MMLERYYERGSFDGRNADRRGIYARGEPSVLYHVARYYEVYRGFVAV